MRSVKRRGTEEASHWQAFGVGQHRGTDPDGDGMPNLLEYLADTNPTNALSVLSISQIIPEANGLRIECQGGTAARQFLERSRSIGTADDDWVTLFTNHPPTPLQTNLFDLLGTNRALFYRVRTVRE